MAYRHGFKDDDRDNVKDDHDGSDDDDDDFMSDDYDNVYEVDCRLCGTTLTKSIDSPTKANISVKI